MIQQGLRPLSYFLVLISVLLVCPFANAQDVTEDAPSLLASSARIERQQIVSSLDRKAAEAKNLYGIDVSVMGALEACAPLDASVETCSQAAEKISLEIDAEVEREIRLRQLQDPNTPVPQVNVTIIEQHDTVIFPPHRNRPTRLPDPPGEPPAPIVKPGLQPPTWRNPIPPFKNPVPR